MTNLLNWISPEVLRTLGWTLLHFIWQGEGLAALFAVATAVCRSSTARYALAVSALVLMMVSPVITFTWLRAPANPAVRTGAGGASTSAGTSTRNAIALSSSLAPVAESRSEEHTSELQSPCNLVCRLLLEKKKKAFDDPSAFVSVTQQ